MRIRDWSSDVCSSDLPRAVQAALSKAGLTAADVDKFIFPTTLKGVEGQLAKSLGIRADAVVGNLASQVGDTGVGHGLLMLAGVLAEARPGSVILMLEFGAGAEAVLFRTTDRITRLRPRRGLEDRQSTRLNSSH